MRIIDIIINPKYEKIVRPLNPEESALLKGDITKHKRVLQRVILNRNNVCLDGHHRIKFAKGLGLTEVPHDVLHFDDPLDEWEFVVTSNRNRRQLTTLDKAVLANELHKIEQERTARLRPKIGGRPPKKESGDGYRSTAVTHNPKRKSRPKRKIDPDKKRKSRARSSRHKSAEKFGLGEKTLEHYQAVMNSKYDDLKKDLENRSKTVNQAHNEMMKRDNYEKRKAELQLSLSQTKPKKFERPHQIHCGDCREFYKTLARGSINLILTDPPYSREYLPLYQWLGRMADELLADGGSLITIIPQYAEEAVYQLIKSGIKTSFGDSTLQFWWNLTLMHSGGHELFRARGIDIGCKKMLWYVKGNKRATGYIVQDPVKSAPPDKTLDDWAQSVPESEYLITRVTEPGWTVLDPFMGTGTNGIATLNTKRKFIGIELLPEKYGLAEAKLDRLGSEVLAT